MKLWEILKEENIGRLFKCNNGKEYMVKKDKNNNLMVCKKNTFIPENFCSNKIMELNFELISKNGWEKVEDYKNIYFIDSTGIDNTQNIHDLFEKELSQNYNYFSTKEKAEEIAKKELLYRQMKKFYDENDGKINFTDGDMPKWSIYYDIDNEQFTIKHYYSHCDLHKIYFSTKELAERCLNEIVRPFYNKYYKGNFNR